METDKRILILDQKLIEKIDLHRGDLNRAEFIELCIDTCMESEEAVLRPEPEKAVLQKPSSAVTREDFQEFKRSTKDLIRALLEFFITFGLDLGPKKETDDPGILKSQLRSLLKDL